MQTLLNRAAQCRTDPRKSHAAPPHVQIGGSRPPTPNRVILVLQAYGFDPVGEFAFSVLSMTYKKVSQKSIPYDLKGLCRQWLTSCACADGRSPAAETNIVMGLKERGPDVRCRGKADLLGPIRVGMCHEPTHALQQATCTGCKPASVAR